MGEAALAGTDEVFAPPGEAWVRVSPKLITARRLVLGMVLVPLTLLAAGLAGASPAPSWVVAGPIDRWLGITTVQLHTAAATSDAAIPGLPPAEAAALRDRLAAVGEQRSAGL